MLQRVLSCLSCVPCAFGTFYYFLFFYEFQHFVCCAFILLFVKREKWAEVGGSSDLLLYIFCIGLVMCVVFVLCWNGQDDCVLHIVHAFVQLFIVSILYLNACYSEIFCVKFS